MSEKAWPNRPTWMALRDGAQLEVEGVPWHFRVVDCGELSLPSGRVIACDPFVELEDAQVFAVVPPGRYPVKVTIADVGGEGDRSHEREAWASLILRDGVEVFRTPMVPPDEDEPDPDSFYGFGVDAGTACFADQQAVARARVPEDDWYGRVFDHDGEDAWFRRMDDPAHIEAGLANLPLPGARPGDNVVLFHSGWGDGFYPVVGGYDAEGRLLALHIDFFVVDPEDGDGGD